MPQRFAPAINAAAQRWSVSAVLLSAQLYAESGFNPFATSPAGAQGIAQFMPGTARGMGLDDPFDPGQAIDAQAHLMRDLLRQFATVPLALAAYNAGPAPVSACGCVPAFPETRGYVARILGLMNGAGEGLTGGRRRGPGRAPGPVTADLARPRGAVAFVRNQHPCCRWRRRRGARAPDRQGAHFESIADMPLRPTSIICQPSPAWNGSPA